MYVHKYLISKQYTSVVNKFVSKIDKKIHVFEESAHEECPDPVPCALAIADGDQ